MADIDVLRQRLKNIRQQMETALPDIAVILTMSAKALAEKTIRDEGFGAQYSTKHVPAFFLLGKEKSNAGRNFIENKIKQDEKNTHVQDGVKYYPADDGLNWKELREAEGLPTDHVNLSFTNKMWAGIGPQDVQVRGGVYVCPLGGSTAEVVDKLKWQFSRYGDFFSKVLVPQMPLLQQTVITEVQKVLKANPI